MSQKITIDDLKKKNPILIDAHKKKPIQPRLEVLESLVDIDDLKNIEPYFVDNILEIIIKRTDDKPQVSEKAFEVGKNIISKLSIQAFPRVIQVLFRGMTVESKWKSKLGSLTFLGDYIDRVEKYDRDLLSSCLPELVRALTDIIYDTKVEVADMTELVLRKSMRGITNRDLEPFIEDLIKAIKNRDETEETIQKFQVFQEGLA